jgi:NADH-quinone oxidoreductase subunit J
VVSHPKPVYSALYFVLTVLASAGLFILAWAEFMAAALVLIYAGAILVTYVFVIMLASQAQSGATGEGGDVGAEYDRVSREPLAASIAGFALMGVILFLIFDDAAIRRADVSGATPTTQPTTQMAMVAATQPVMMAADNDAAGTPSVVLTGGPSAMRQLGHYLFTEQLLTLELAGVILTLGMVGAIVIARKQVTEIPKETWGAATGPGEAEKATGGVDDNPHSIPVFGTTNPQHKAYPET